MATGQLFSRTTQALFYNYKQLPIQRMLDFDFLCGMFFFLLLIFIKRGRVIELDLFFLLFLGLLSGDFLLFIYSLLCLQGGNYLR
jgi:hypothetical protein